MEKDFDTQACLHVVSKITHKLSGIFDETEAVQLFLSEIIAELDADGALIRMLDPSGNMLMILGAAGLSEDYLKKGNVKLAESEVDQRVLHGEVVVVQDVTSEPGFQYPKEADQEGLQGMVIVPLTIRNRQVGVLRIYIKDVNVIDQVKITLLCILADMCALTIEKIHLHQSLYRIAQALNSTLNLEELLNKLLEATVVELGLKAASIRLLDPRNKLLKLVAAYGLSEAYLDKGDIHIEKSPIDNRVLMGETVVLYDVAKEPGFEYPKAATREGIRSVLVVPLLLRERALGVMRVYSSQPRSFGNVATTFLTSVASLVALSIENAELYSALQGRYDDLKLDLAEWYRFLALG